METDEPREELQKTGRSPVSPYPGAPSFPRKGNLPLPLPTRGVIVERANTTSNLLEVFEEIGRNPVGFLSQIPD